MTTFDKPSEFESAQMTELRQAMTDDPQYRERLARAAKKFVDDYDWWRWVDVVDAILAEQAAIEQEKGQNDG